MKTIGKIYISKILATKLGLPEKPVITIRAGHIILNTELIIKNNDRSTYMLSPTLAGALYIKKRKKMQLRYDAHAEMLHLGPTIGILSTFLPNKGEFDPTSVQAELIFLSNVGKILPGQVYIFTPNSINWTNKTTRGYVYRQVSPERGVWVSAIYPLPDVVYDRIASRKGEARQLIKETKKKLMELPYLKYFNPFFLNKWQVHQMLENNFRLKPHLPETKPLTTENLEEMLSKYKTLYLKPSNGSLGLGIIKVTRDERGVLRYVVHRRKRMRSQADSATQLMKKTRSFRSGKPYIVQQGIPLATYRGSPFDLRIIYQKNRHGQWQIGKKFVRVAARGSVVSNLSSGGRAVSSKKVMRYLFRKPNIINQKNREIKEICQTIAETVEIVTRRTFGELGLDIGIDNDGHPWLIEVNSKPRKTTETEMSRVIMRNAFKRPLEYSIYLAGF